MTPAEKLKEALNHPEYDHVRIATAESLTAGMISGMIASVSGASRYLAGGVVAYNLDQKVNLLGVDRELALVVDCVSSEIAMQMVQGVRKVMNVQGAISATGYAEGDEPHAWIGISWKGDTQVFRIDGSPGMTRNELRQKVAEESILALATLIHTPR